MDTPESYLKALTIPKIRAESEAQTTGHLIKVQNSVQYNMDNSENMTLRQRRNLSKNRGQGTRLREKTPEPSRTPIAHEDTPSSDEDEPKKTSREIEADYTYEETKRMLLEKSGEKDDDDIEQEELIEARNRAENERRRRSISPFALPEKEESSDLHRTGSFIDPSTKLLSTTYTLSPKDEDPKRRGSLVIEANARKNSLSSLSPSLGPSSGSPRDLVGFTFPADIAPKKLEQMTYPDEVIHKDEVIKEAETPESIERKSKSPELHKKSINLQEETKEKSEPSELKTRIIQIERSPSKKLPEECRPNVEIHRRVNRTPSKKELKPVMMAQKAAVTVKEVEERVIPIKPPRSKSSSRVGARRMSESETSEDLNTKYGFASWKKGKNKFLQTPKRFQRSKSPRGKRSQSVNRIEDLIENTGKSMSETGRDIVELLQKVRGRSVSIPKNYTNNNINYPKTPTRTLRTPNATTPPLSRRTRGVSCPKTIHIISEKEILSSIKKAQKKRAELEKSRQSSGYVDASQSEYSSSCYSTSPSENEFEFDLLSKTDELKKKLALLSSKEDIPDTTESDLSHNKVTIRRRHQTNKRHHSNKAKTPQPKTTELLKSCEPNPLKQGRFRKLCNLWKEYIAENRIQYIKVLNSFKRCLCDLVLIVIICGLGGILFKNLEGSYENVFKCSSKGVKRDFIEQLWKGSHHLREEDWKSLARTKLFEFENQLQEAFEAGVSTYSGKKSWNFMNSFVYCLTIVTTIGYGHLTPSTASGRVATIIYATFGIPLFLIVLADFGKLFTRITKFLWAFVRRLYYNGNCKKVRRTVPMQEMMKGLNMFYDVVRRPSQINLDPNDPKFQESHISPDQVSHLEPGTEPETPAVSTYEIDDEFNVPISVAIVIQIIYILLGATMYSQWEAWTFFEAFYFVFISMSTIGFGDLVPAHPMFMMASLPYLIFGLALTSMCINVVQLKLSDTFRQASAKIGATMGLQVADEDGALVAITPDPVEVAPVHGKFEAKSENKDK